jgi:hypothetical protein
MSNAVNEYASEITLGETYIDRITGVQGTAVDLCFCLDGTQQVALEYGSLESSGTVTRKREWFDADRVLS